jgi:hypothetical protein
MFPRGVQGVTALTYVEQHATLKAQLPALREGGKRAQDVAALGLAGYVERLAALNDAYGAKVAPGSPDRIAHDQIRSHQADGQRRLLKVLVHILAAYDEESDAHVAARDRLLRPILDQNAAIGVHRRNRRQPTDVDPETGEEVIDAVVPPVEAG